MEVAQLVERIRIMAARSNPDAIRSLLESPDVELLGILWSLRRLDDEGLVARCAAIPAGRAADVQLVATELDPEIARLLEKIEITTVAEADAAADETLLELKGLSLFRLEELRAVVRKYVGGAAAATPYGPVWERVRGRIEKALAAKMTTKEIVSRYKVHHLDVQRVLRETKTLRRA